MGLQIINEDKRKAALERSSSNKVIAEAIRLFKSSGIYVTCDTILGIPGENDEDLSHLAYFYDSYLPDHIEIFWLRYYPKTNISDWALKEGYISRKEIDEIEEGAMDCGITSGGIHPTRAAKQLMLLLYLFQVVPHKLRRYVLDKRLYRYFPHFLPPIALYTLSRVYGRSRNDLNVTRTAKRYFYFAIKKFLP
jgi:radical SAM superfamily enzyme YgiQ (UPF0313 family)